ncbi:penicillin-binding protein 2 [Sedimenticola selenatireducens]|uniref:Peptidoglycan D,D-transpeptidase MrdA n=1 Tax=Sedimenticola selenatireducens TaxID=191960 RepID=A0A2N6CTH7_9GAMM|nr:penicillin-binding protein 2 [Sedimenticola selenatireducens]PLX60469.1 MAG: penicillin-binding protein 2 [Sedimenticola selenatireducens]
MYQATLKDYLRESRLFRARAITATLIILLLLLLLILHLAKLQIIDHAHFTTLSRDNRVKVEPLPPTRGLIYDRNGVILAQNLPTHSLEITPERVKDLDWTLQELGKLISISDNDRKRFNRLKSHQRRFESIPIRVQLSDEEVARFAVNRHLFPGVDIQAKLLRDYPLKDVTAHILGYVGRINKRELQTIDNSSYSGTTHIGKNGIEKYYEETLHGKVGLQQVEINALGRVIRILESKPPEPGADLHLTLDSALQRVAIESFGEESGAAVAIDPQTGDILAMVSKPGFDPNLFVEGISSADYNALQTSEEKPLFNRAIRGQYPPGSTIKPFIGLGGLESGVITATRKNYCPGFFQLPNHSHKYRDWKKAGHGAVDLYDAIAQSCDVYYYDLAQQMGIDKLAEYLAPFGFGEKTGVDITGELGGLLPAREWKRRSKNQPWYPGETLITGIGQGYFLTTPLQLASATATLASGGSRLQPRIVKSIRRNGEPDPREQPVSQQQQIARQSESHWDSIVEAMIQVTEGVRGTARLIRNEHYRIAGKTGTAQVFTIKQEEKYEEEKLEKKMRDHALFIAFAPADAPRIAVAVIVENGGHGGSVAAPIAKAIMDRYLLQDTR